MKLTKVKVILLVISIILFAMYLKTRQGKELSIDYLNNKYHNKFLVYSQTKANRFTKYSKLYAYPNDCKCLIDDSFVLYYYNLKYYDGYNLLLYKRKYHNKLKGILDEIESNYKLFISYPIDSIATKEGVEDVKESIYLVVNENNYINSEALFDTLIKRIEKSEIIIYLYVLSNNDYNELNCLSELDNYKYLYFEKRLSDGR